MSGRFWALALCLGALACDEARPPDALPATPDTGTVRITLIGHLNVLELGGRRLPSGRVFHLVTLKLENGRASSVPTAPDHYTLQTGNPTATRTAAAESSRLDPVCRPQTASGMTLECELAFETATSESLLKLHYDGGPEIGADASFEGMPLPAPICAVQSDESSASTCRDACDDDGDGYLDCGDSDCCAVRADCPTDSYCGVRAAQCVLGPESRFAACNDVCDNDGNELIDCNDSGCCGLVVCAPGTLCGAQPDPFSGALVFDDAALARIVPSTLGAGPTPCRPPMRAHVRFARDGDTLEVDDIPSGTAEVVRIIGVNTPEVAHDGMPDECFGPEARTFTRQLVGHDVWLTFDGECTDPYARTLAYVYYGASPNQMLERQLLRRGFGRVLSFAATSSFEDQFKADEALARGSRAGLFTACP